MILVKPMNEYSFAPILIPLKKHQLSNQNDPVCKIHCDGGSHLATSSKQDTDTPYLGRTLTLGQGANFEETPFKNWCERLNDQFNVPCFYMFYKTLRISGWVRGHFVCFRLNVSWITRGHVWIYLKRLCNCTLGFWPASWRVKVYFSCCQAGGLR